jgi:hypothetical protein
MISFKDNKSELDDLYWTKKYQKQQEIKNYKSGNKKPNNYKKAFVVILVTIGLMTIIYFINHSSKLSFLNRSRQTKAILVDYKYSSILVNQMDGSRLKSYLYKYYYFIEGKKIYSSDILDEFRYHNCIDKKYNVGDTIIIRYLKNDPSKSKINCN